MWRDVLIVLAFVFAALHYFGISPRQIIGYSKTAKVEVAKRALYQRIYLLLVVIISIALVTVFVYRFEQIQLEDRLFAILLFIILWLITLQDVWKLSETGHKIANIVKYGVALPLFITVIVLFDMPLWQKIAYPVGGFCIGFIVSILGRYIARAAQRKRSLNE